MPKLASNAPWLSHRELSEWLLFARYPGRSNCTSLERLDLEHSHAVQVSTTKPVDQALPSSGQAGGEPMGRCQRPSVVIPSSARQGSQCLVSMQLSRCLQCPSMTRYSQCLGDPIDDRLNRPTYHTPRRWRREACRSSIRFTRADPRRARWEDGGGDRSYQKDRGCHILAKPGNCQRLYPCRGIKANIPYN